MMDLQEREKKIALAELKEKISHFLYRQFIDFERDKRIIVHDQEVRPSFYLNKYAVIIECVDSAKPGNPDYDAFVKAYTGDEFKVIFLDLNNIALKNADQFLKEQLIELGCKI